MAYLGQLVLYCSPAGQQAALVTRLAPTTDDATAVDLTIFPADNTPCCKTNVTYSAPGVGPTEWYEPILDISG